MLWKISITVAALSSLALTDQNADVSTCSASDGSGSGCSSKVKAGRQKVTANELLNLLSEPGMKPLKRAHKLVQQRHVNVLEFYGREIPLVVGVVKAYMNQDVQHVTMKQYKIRRQKILQILSEMFSAGADANMMLTGRQALQLAMEDGDVAFCRCLIKGGARLADKDGFLYRWLAHLWGSSSSVAEVVKIIISLREDIAAGNLKPDALHLTTHDKYLNMYDVSPGMRKLVHTKSSVAANDFSRFEITNVLVDTMEALLAEFTSAVDFSRVVAAGHRAPDGRNVFHYVACAVPRSILAFAQAAVQAGAEAAKTMLKMLQEGNVLGQTPFHLAAACSSTSQQPSTRTFDALLTAVEELSAAAGVKIDSKDVYLTQLPKDNSGLSYLDHAASAHKVQSNDTNAFPHLSYSAELSGGWSISGDAAVKLDASPPGRCDVLVLKSPLPAKDFTRLLVSTKPALLRGEALRYKIRKRWRKNDFLKKHGKRILEVAEIPYADVFGMASEKLTVKDFVDNFAKLSSNTSSSTEAFRYAFGADLMHKNPALRNDVESEPPVLKGVKVNRMPVSVSPPQFYLGPPSSGAPMHFHKDAVNILVYGRKRWFLHPPTQAMYSKRPTAQWMPEIKNMSSSAQPWECVQEAGDVIYVPNGWAHATINIEESIGVAYEFESVGLTTFS